MIHEALAAISIQMEPDDYIVPYYSDRGLILGRGMTTRQLGLEYFEKLNTGSGGRQMPSHYSNADLHIWSVPTPTGSQLLPACGIAWGIQLDGKKSVVVTTVGDAATRQGDFVRERKEFAPPLRRRRQCLWHQHADSEDKPARARSPSSQRLAANRGARCWKSV